MIMRELSLPEIRLVAGGNGGDGPSVEDTRRLGTVVVVGQRTGSTDWSAFANGTHGFSALTPVQWTGSGDGGGGGATPDEIRQACINAGKNGDVGSQWACSSAIYDLYNRANGESEVDQTQRQPPSSACVAEGLAAAAAESILRADAVDRLIDPRNLENALSAHHSYEACLLAR